jgi:hypothetical protein
MMSWRDAVEATPLPLTHYVYTPAAIEETIRAFHELVEIESEAQEESTLLRLHPKADCPITVCDDFLNYALELSAQELLSGKE